MCVVLALTVDNGERYLWVCKWKSLMSNKLSIESSAYDITTLRDLLGEILDSPIAIHVDNKEIITNIVMRSSPTVLCNCNM